MDSWYVLGVFGAPILAAVGAMVIAVRAGVRAWPVTQQPSAMPADLQVRVRRLLDSRQADQAVREVREATGFRLRDAKGIVDGLRDAPLPEAPAGAVSSPASLAERARNLRNGGDLTSAVTLVCTESGMTQREAELFVSALD